MERHEYGAHIFGIITMAVYTHLNHEVNIEDTVTLDVACTELYDVIMIKLDCNHSNKLR